MYSGLDHRFEEPPIGLAEWASPLPFPLYPAALRARSAASANPQLVRALDTCAARDFVGEMDGDAKGLVCHPSCSIVLADVFAKLGVKYLMQKPFVPGSVFA